MEELDGADYGGEMGRTCWEGIAENCGEGKEFDHDERIHGQDREGGENYSGEWLADE